MANSQPMMIDAEPVHNWSQRYSHIRTGQLGELSQEVRAAILRAHVQHHRDGLNASEAAKALAEQFPGRLYYQGI